MRSKRCAVQNLCYVASICKGLDICHFFTSESWNCLTVAPAKKVYEKNTSGLSEAKRDTVNFRL